MRPMRANITALGFLASLSLAVLPRLAAAQHTHEHARRADSDTAFTAMQSRGKSAMGVDQYTSAHQFEELPDGGRIELQRDSTDSAGVAEIRAHLQSIAKAFAGGDFGAAASAIASIRFRVAERSGSSPRTRRRSARCMSFSPSSGESIGWRGRPTHSDRASAATAPSFPPKLRIDSGIDTNGAKPPTWGSHRFRLQSGTLPGTRKKSDHHT